MSAIQQEQHDNIVELRRELAQWKNNHKNVVERLRLATQRKDLPVDRIPAINRMYELQEQVERLTAELAEVHSTFAHINGVTVDQWNKLVADSEVLHSRQAAVPAVPNYFHCQEAAARYGIDYNKFCAAHNEVLSRLAPAPQPIKDN